MSYVLTFAAGFIVGLATWLLWLALRFAADVKAAREAVADYTNLGDNPKDLAAKQAVENCKNRLRWQKRLNPEWLPPLVDEIPKLVREIAAVYHPAHPEPLLAPGWGNSHARCIWRSRYSRFPSDALYWQTRRCQCQHGFKNLGNDHKIATHETMQTVGKWYKRCSRSGRW